MSGNRITFALSGLGGNNAYGAGFLAAAQYVQQQRVRPADPEAAARHDLRIMPALAFVSCTSGTIAMVAEYLRGDDLRTDLEAAIAVIDRAIGLPRTAWTDPWRGAVAALWTGVPEVFGPYRQALAEHLWRRFTGFFTPGSPWYGAVPTTVDELLDVWLPARSLVPELPDAFFTATAETFTTGHHGIGVAFNSFDPSTGEEYLYLNEPALRLVRTHHDPAAEFGSRHDRTVYQPISPDGVRRALRLVWYGFDAGRPAAGQHIDGVYARSIIMDELTFADRIYAVKPINHRWLGRLPQNALELQDMQTELWMGVSYREQRRLINTVNDLIAAGRLTEPDGGGKAYHHVDLVPVEIAVQRGFFTYFVEDLAVFDDAYAQALDVLRRYTAAATPG